MVSYVLKGGTSCYRGGTSRSGPWYLNLLGGGGTLSSGGCHLTYGGTKRFSGWYLSDGVVAYMVMDDTSTF